MLCILLNSVSIEGVYLVENSGATSDGMQIVDVETDVTGRAEVELVFKVPAEKIIAAGKVKNIHVPKSLKVEFGVRMKKMLGS